jgi:hypothetical protein
VLSNPSMKGLLKIGLTTRNVVERVNELNRETGVPSNFVIECYFSSENPQQDETRIHQTLSDYRMEKKEFFQIEFFEALKRIQDILKKPPFFIQKHRDKVWVEQQRLKQEKKRLEDRVMERERFEKVRSEKERRENARLEKGRKEVVEKERSKKTAKYVWYFYISIVVLALSVKWCSP